MLPPFDNVARHLEVLFAASCCCCVLFLLFCFCFCFCLALFMFCLFAVYESVATLTVNVALAEMFYGLCGWIILLCCDSLRLCCCCVVVVVANTLLLSGATEDAQRP